MNINTMLEEIDSATLDTEIAILEAYVDAMEKCINICENVNDYTNFENIKFITESFVMEADNKTGESQPAETKPADGDSSAQATAPAAGDNNTAADAAKPATNNAPQQKSVFKRFLEAIAALFRKLAAKITGNMPGKADPNMQLDPEFAQGLIAYARGDENIEPETLNRVTAYVKALAAVGIGISLGTGGYVVYTRLKNRDTGEKPDLEGKPDPNKYNRPQVQVDETGTLRMTILFPNKSFQSQQKALNDSLEHLETAVINIYNNAIEMQEAFNNGNQVALNKANKALFDKDGYLSSVENALNNPERGIGLNTLLTRIESTSEETVVMTIKEWNQWYEEFVEGFLYRSASITKALAAIIPNIHRDEMDLAAIRDELRRSNAVGRGLVQDYSGLNYLSDKNRVKYDAGAANASKWFKIKQLLSTLQSRKDTKKINQAKLEGGEYKDQLDRVRAAVNETLKRINFLEEYYSDAIRIIRAAYDDHDRHQKALKKAAKQQQQVSQPPTPPTGQNGGPAPTGGGNP